MKEIEFMIYQNRITKKFFYYPSDRPMTMIVFPTAEETANHCLVKEFPMAVMYTMFKHGENFKGIVVHVFQKKRNWNPFFKKLLVVARLDVAGLEENAPKGFAKEEK